MNRPYPIPYAPDHAQSAIAEVVVSMASDAVRFGNEARAELDRLDETLRVIQEHVNHVVEDYGARVRAIQTMYLNVKRQAKLAQRALFDGPLQPPTPPPEVAELLENERAAE